MNRYFKQALNFIEKVKLNKNYIIFYQNEPVKKIEYNKETEELTLWLSDKARVDIYDTDISTKADLLALKCDLKVYEEVVME